MANFLSRDRQIQVLSLLCEGNSIRSTERLTGISRNAIMRLTVRFGNACRDFLDEALGNLSLRHIQCDEIWTFVQKKQRRLYGPEVNNPRIGDIYLYTALDTDTKLLVTFAVGKRNAEVTESFIADLEKRLVRPPVLSDDVPQISTDGWSPYPGAIIRAFGRSVRHGVLIKNYVNPESGRYAPPELVKADRFNVQGIRDLSTICTSHVERCNLTIRTFMKRFTRLALGFSKKLENLAAAAALHIAFYNFCRLHRTLRATPAMAAGVVDQLWDMGDLFDAVMDRAERQKRDAGLRKLLDRLNRTEL